MTMQAVARGTRAWSPEEPEGPRVGELVRELRDEIALLAKQEVALAKAELLGKVKNVALGTGMVVAALAIALFSLVALTVLLIVALDEVLPLWAAAMGVAALYLFAAAGLFLLGMSRFRRIGSPLPTHTMHRIKEDLRWLRREAL